MSDHIKDYLQEISKFPILTGEEQLELVRAAHQGNLSARHTLLNSNLRLVVSIAKKYGNQNLPLIDVIQEGNLGLMKAVDRFDCEKGVKFDTYASYWIKQSITEALAKNGRAIRIPCSILKIIKEISRATTVLFQEFGKEPSIREISDYLRLPEKKLIDAYSTALTPISLNQPLNHECAAFIEDFIQSEPNALPAYAEGFNSDEERKSILKEVLKTVLHPHEEKIMILRYGLGDESPRTLEEVGRIFGVTRERIRQIENSAIRKLRKNRNLEDLL